MRIDRLAFLAVVAIALQVTLGDLARIRGATPDLLFLLAAWIAFHARIEDALLPVWLVGLVKDCASLADFGAFGFLFTLACVFLSNLKDYLFRDSLWVQVSLVFLAACLYNSLYGLDLARESETLVWSWAIERSALSALYTALCAPVAFVILDGFRRYLRLSR